MKKKHWNLLLLATNLLFSVGATVPVANIQINGKITPPTCTVNGAAQSDVIFDLGAISPSLIPISEPYIYPRNIRSNKIIIECDAVTYLTFNATDTYATSALTFPSNISANIQPLIFRLVDTQDTSKSVGGIIYYWWGAQVDGNDVFVSRSNDINANAGGGNNLLVAEATNGWTHVQQMKTDIDKLDLSPGKVFSLSFSTTSGTASYPIFIISQQELETKEIDISNGLDFTGETVLTFRFGI